MTRISGLTVILARLRLGHRVRQLLAQREQHLALAVADAQKAHHVLHRLVALPDNAGHVEGGSRQIESASPFVRLDIVHRLLAAKGLQNHREPFLLTLVKQAFLLQ